MVCKQWTSNNSLSENSLFLPYIQRKITPKIDCNGTNSEFKKEVSIYGVPDIPYLPSVS